MPSDPFIAEIMLFAGNFAPRGWAFCNGQLLAISSNTALFSLVGTIYGGDGRTTFGLPDLRSRIPLHPGQGPGLSNYLLGQKSGVENVTLTQNQMPSHTHAATTVVTPQASPSEGDSTDPAGRVWAKSGQGDPDYAAHDPGTAVAMDGLGASATTSLGNTGGSGSHTNVQPVIAINYVIATIGTFPSRN